MLLSQRPTTDATNVVVKDIGDISTAMALTRATALIVMQEAILVGIALSTMGLENGNVVHSDVI